MQQKRSLEPLLLDLPACGFKAVVWKARRKQERQKQSRDSGIVFLTRIRDKRTQDQREGPSQSVGSCGRGLGLGLGRSPAKQLSGSPSAEPPSPPPLFGVRFICTSCLWDPVSLRKAGRTWIRLRHYSAVRPLPSLPSCLSLGPGFQRRMGDNPLIGAQKLRPAIRLILSRSLSVAVRKL